MGDVLGTIESLAGRVIGPEEQAVFEFLFQILFGRAQAEAALAAGRLDIYRGAHERYLKARPEKAPRKGLYEGAYQAADAEPAILATLYEHVSPALERELKVNPLAFAVIVHEEKPGLSEQAVRESLAHLVGAEVMARVIVVPVSRGKAGETLAHILSGKHEAGKRLLREMRSLAGTGWKQSDLLRHTTVFAREEVLQHIPASSAVKLAVGEDQGIDPAHIHLYGNTLGFLLARKGGDYDALVRQLPDLDGRLIAGSGVNSYRLNPFGLKERVSELVAAFQGFQAVLRAA